MSNTVRPSPLPDSPVNPGRKAALLALLHALRLPLAMTVIADLWLAHFLAQSERGGQFLADVGQDLTTLLQLAVLGLGLTAFGSIFNDMVDQRRDRLFFPQRAHNTRSLPIPLAASALSISLLLAIFMASLIGTGSTLITLLIAAGIVSYNLVGKFLPAVGIVSLGLMRAMAYYIPDPTLAFGFPAMLAMTHVIACAAIRYRLEGKRPRLEGAELWALLAGWTFWFLLLVLWVAQHEHPLIDTHPLFWIAPAIAAGIFALLTYRLIAKIESRPVRIIYRVGQSFGELAMLWLIVFAAAWAIGVGLYLPALILGLPALVGFAIWLGLPLSRLQHRVE